MHRRVTPLAAPLICDGRIAVRRKRLCVTGGAMQALKTSSKEGEHARQQIIPSDANGRFNQMRLAIGDYPKRRMVALARLLAVEERMPVEAPTGGDFDPSFVRRQRQAQTFGT